MKYNRYTVKIITEAEDVVSSILMDIGVQGVEVQDKIPLSEKEKAEMFVDIPPTTGEDDGIAYLSFYLDADENNEEMLADIKRELDEMKDFMDIGECSITMEELADEDYLNNWKQFFHQFYIDDILFIPSWEDVKAEDEEKMVIHIDPGTAFGTGKHETTNLCIRALRKYINKDDVVLDVGTGSGILSLMAHKFGAKTTFMTDLDPCAVAAVEDNMTNNGLKDADSELIIGNIIDDKSVQDKAGYEKYDMVLANILTEVLVPLTPVVANHIKKGGIYITSGIIDDKEPVIVEAIKANDFEILEINHQGEWVGVVAKKL